MSQTIVKKTFPYLPDYIIPVPPGEILEEKLAEMAMTAEQLAESTGLELEQIVLLLRGAVPLTSRVAEKLENITEIPANNWNRYELRYRNDLQKAAQKYGLDSTE